MKTIFASAVTLGVLAISAPAMAQDRDAHFDGPYVQAFGGYSFQNNDRRDTLVFDTDQDGSFDNNVLTHISGDFQQTPENLQFPATTTTTTPPAATTSQLSQ